jgi:hypothetical protein
MGRPDPNQEALARLIGNEAPAPGPERVDGPSLELVIAMRQSQPIGQVRARRQFLGSQDPAARVRDLKPRDYLQGAGHGLVHRPVLCKCAGIEACLRGSLPQQMILLPTVWSGGARQWRGWRETG